MRSNLMHRPAVRSRTTTDVYDRHAPTRQVEARVLAQDRPMNALRYRARSPIRAKLYDRIDTFVVGSVWSGA